MNKKILKISTLAAVLAFCSQNAAAQQGFGSNTPSKASVIELKSEYKGLLIPRVALTDLTNFAPIKGELGTAVEKVNSLLVFNKTTDATKNLAAGYYYWTTDGITGSWKRLIANDDTAALNLLGDVTGTLGATTVVKLQGKPIDAAAPSANQVLTWDGSKWTPKTMNANQIEGRQDVTAASEKVTLAGTPTGAALQPFSIDVNEAKLTLSNIGGKVTNAQITQGGPNQVLVTSNDGLTTTWIDQSVIAPNTTNELTLLDNKLVSTVNGVATPEVDLAVYMDNTDNQEITDLSMSGNTLSIEIERGNTKTVDLSGLTNTTSLANGTNTSVSGTGTSTDAYKVNVPTASKSLGVVKQAATNPSVLISPEGELSVDARTLISGDGKVQTDNIIIVSGSGTPTETTETSLEHAALKDVYLAIRNGSITATQLAANSVTTDKIQDGHVTTEKIGAGQVQTSNIGAGQVTSEKIAENAVTATKIADKNVSASKLDGGAGADGRVAVADAAGVITYKVLGPESIQGADVTAVSNKVTLGGTPAGASLKPFTIDVNEANLSLQNIGGKLLTNQITPGTANQILTTVNGNASWVNPADVVKANQKTSSVVTGDEKYATVTSNTPQGSENTEYTVTVKKTPRFFYMPAVIFNTDHNTAVGVELKRDLYQLYANQFSGQPHNIVQGANASGTAVVESVMYDKGVVSSQGANSLEVFDKGELEYHITYYDTSVFSDLSIDANGVLSYKIIGESTPMTYMNIVFVIK